jgi:hypothetical protein
MCEGHGCYLGITRENIHYKTATEFYPLAELFYQL